MKTIEFFRKQKAACERSLVFAQARGDSVAVVNLKEKIRHFEKAVKMFEESGEGEDEKMC